MWEVEYTNEFFEWFDALDEHSQELIAAAVVLLQRDGPTLGRPYVDSITGSRHANMKELRPVPSNIRVLFAFDQRRTAILLIGGDKTGLWDVWYNRMIPVADRLYDEHLEELRREGESK